MTIAIVGGGAAGLMAAVSALEQDPHAEVVLIEKNDGLGKKVLISGGGRCNVTTGVLDVRTVLTKYPRGGKFLTTAMYAFPPAEVAAWFEARGVPLKTEEDLRVFPRSDDGHDVVQVFERLLAASHAKILLKTQVQAIALDPQKRFVLTFRDGRPPLSADAVILTTGGQAYRHTGSTGDGYALAESLGHTITPLAPSLSAFFTKETWPRDLSGVSFEKAAFTAHGTKTARFTGPFLFTHKGVSGPAVFALSALTAFEPLQPTHPLRISIDVFPDVPAETLLGLLQEAAALHPKKSFVNVLALHMPKSVAETVCPASGTSPDAHAAEVGKKALASIVHWLKGIPLHVIARGAGDEFVTAGGVSLAEVDPRHMQSNKCPGLFFAGELLDVDGFTGGFNLQASWATGRLAGQSAVEWGRSRV
jgi:predicted Rossmann fold flavoprotein